MEILILGGGVVGVTTAYQLVKDGHQVKVIDLQPPGMGGASYGNAGLIATGHSIAWGSPKALKIWFDSIFQQDPVFRMKFQADSQFIRWGLKFLAQCTKQKAKKILWPNIEFLHILKKYLTKSWKKPVSNTSEMQKVCFIFIEIRKSWQQALITYVYCRRLDKQWKLLTKNVHWK